MDDCELGLLLTTRRKSVAASGERPLVQICSAVGGALHCGHVRERRVRVVHGFGYPMRS